MDIPQHVRARAYERTSPHEPLIGRYIRINLAARPNLLPTFDAVAQMIVRDHQASETVPFARVTWAIVFVGIEPHERERIAEVQRQYLEMWDNHPDVWPQIRGRDGVVRVWFVDQSRRPFLGCVCEETPWDVWVSGRDVREDRIYRKFISEGLPPIMMALNAVHADELTEPAGSRAA